MTPDATPPELLRAAHCSVTPDKTRAPDEASDAARSGVGGVCPVVLRKMIGEIVSDAARKEIECRKTQDAEEKAYQQGRAWSLGELVLKLDGVLGPKWGLPCQE